jgi:hypothetical protein
MIYQQELQEDVDCVPELSDGGGCRQTPCSWPPGGRSPGPAAAGSSSPAPGTPTQILTFIHVAEPDPGSGDFLTPGSGIRNW